MPEKSDSDNGLLSEFLSEYQRHQESVWPGQTDKWTHIAQRTNPPNHGNKFEAKGSTIPVLNETTDSFKNTDTKQIAINVEQMIQAGNSFIFQRPQSLPDNRGYKTFMNWLNSLAQKHGYTIIQTGNDAKEIELWPPTRQFFEKTHQGTCGKFGISSRGDTAGDTAIDELYTPKSAQSKLLELNGRIFDGTARIILMATDDDLRYLEDAGGISKLKRLTRNGREGLPKIIFNPKTDWGDVVEKRIASTEVNLEWLLLAQTAPGYTEPESAKSSVCQNAQEVVARRALQVLLNLTRAHPSLVLTGSSIDKKFGRGKSVLLRRIGALAEIAKPPLNDTDRLTRITSWETLRRIRLKGTDQQILEIQNDWGSQGMSSSTRSAMIVDDNIGTELEGMYDETGNNKLSNDDIARMIALARITLLGATNLPQRDIEQFLKAKARNPFLTVMEMPGLDWNA